MRGARHGRGSAIRVVDRHAIAAVGEPAQGFKIRGGRHGPHGPVAKHEHHDAPGMGTAEYPEPLLAHDRRVCRTIGESVGLFAGGLQARAFAVDTFA